MDGFLYGHRRFQRPAEEGPAYWMLQALQSTGIEAFRGLDCDAAICYWDARRENLVLWRSEVPPLYHAFHGGLLCWSTELKPLLRLGVSRELDPLGVDAYLSIGWVPAPWTPLKTVQKLPARHAAVLREGQLHLYSTRDLRWSPKWNHDLPERSRILLGAIEDSVRRRISGESRVGVLVSSGVDSSLILAAAARCGTVGVEGFTYRYEQYEGPLNEGWAARELAAYLGVPHHEIPVGPRWIEEHLEELLLAHEEPFTHGLHSARLDEVVRSGIRVLLTGMGMGWYPNRRQRRADRISRLPHLLVSAAGGALNRTSTILRRVPWRKARSAIRLANEPFRLAEYPLEEIFHRNCQLSIRDASIEPDLARGRLYRDPGRVTRGRDSLLRLIGERLEDGGDLSSADQTALLALELTDADQLLMWGHRWGGRAGISIRAPFVGIPVIEYLARDERRSWNKLEVRKTAEQLMPAHMANRAKRPQSIPVDQWFRGPLRELLTSTVTTENLDACEFFDTAAVLRLVDAHLRGDANHKWVLWAILSLLVWKRLLVDSNTIPSDLSVA